jgi:PEP-CTERM motif
MKSPLKLGATLAVLFFLSAIPAKADSAPSDTMTYTISGSTTATFTISLDSEPDWSENGTAFTMDPLNLMVDGTSMTDTVVFFNSSDLGGLNSVFSCLPDLIGPQLYTGSESDPTFLTGVFELFDIETGASYTLTVTESSSVPEPSTILMLVSGLFAVGLGFRRRCPNPADVN